MGTHALHIRAHGRATLPQTWGVAERATRLPAPEVMAASVHGSEAPHSPTERASLPFAFDKLRASVVFEHQATAIDRFVILAPAPVGVDLLVFPTATALLNMKVVLFVVEVHSTAATIAPDNGEMRVFDLD